MGKTIQSLIREAGGPIFDSFECKNGKYTIHGMNWERLLKLKALLKREMKKDKKINS